MLLFRKLHKLERMSRLLQVLLLKMLSLLVRGVVLRPTSLSTGVLYWGTEFTLVHFLLLELSRHVG